MGKVKSMNKELPEFFLESLEKRLETAPLSIGGLLNLGVDTHNSWCGNVMTCNGYDGCGEMYHCKAHI